MTVVIIADEPYRQGVAAQRLYVADGVCSPSGHELLPVLAKDENRCLTTDPLGRAVEVTVQHQVGQEEHSLAFEAVDQFQ